MIALIAGQGALPGVVAQGLDEVLICALEGFPPDDLSVDRVFCIENLGSFIKGLVASGVGQVCFAGAIARPSLDPSKIDADTMPLVPAMMQAMQQGDDAALRAVIGFFEAAGLDVVATQDLAPHLLLQSGVICGEVTPQDQRDVERARDVHKALASVDVGQGCVVAKGLVLAVEALPGTDWMLSSLIAPHKTRSVPDPDPLGYVVSGIVDYVLSDDSEQKTLDFPRPEGGVFYKAPKPEQDRRIDLPTIGPETVKLAAEAGLNGIAIEAGGVIVLESELVISLTRGFGMFLWVVQPE